MKTYRIIVSVRERSGEDMAVELVDNYTKIYNSLEEMGNDGDLAHNLMEKTQEAIRINNEISRPF